VALLAKHDDLCCAKFCLFHPIQFMLATPQETAGDAAKTLGGRPFFVEDKLDGIRAQVHKQGDAVAIYTRTMDRTDDAFPEIVQAMRQVPGDFLIDGEIVPFAGGAVSPFAHLQRRLGRKRPPAAVLKKYPVAMISFDLLYRNGQMLIDRPLRERRARLQELADASPPGARLNITDVHEVTSEAQIGAAFEAAKTRRNEGLILKDPDSIYSPGRRGKWWLKLKTHLPTLDCVVTAAEYGHGKRRRTLSDYTFAVWRSDPADPGAELVNVGKAYSGVTDAEIAQLTDLFKSIALADDGHTFLVPPRVVMEIAFDQIQKSARHASGYALRFPRIKTIRWDKRPEDADRLPRVEEIYQSAANTSRGAGAVEEVEEEAAAPEPTLFDHLP
jgi:DNA ligase-1